MSGRSWGVNDIDRPRPTFTASRERPSGLGVIENFYRSPTCTLCQFSQNGEGDECSGPYQRYQQYQRPPYRSFAHCWRIKPKSANSPTTNDILAAFERNPYIMGIKYCANDGGFRWQPSWRTIFPLCRKGFSRRPPRPPNISEGVVVGPKPDQPPHSDMSGFGEKQKSLAPLLAYLGCEW